jgi:hypothetical protein
LLLLYYLNSSTFLCWRYPAFWHSTERRPPKISARVRATQLVLLARTVTLAQGTAGPSWCLLGIGGSLQRRPISSVLIGSLTRRGGHLRTLLHLGRRLVLPCRRAPVTVREVRALGHGGDDGLLVQSLPEIDDLLL